MSFSDNYQPLRDAMLCGLIQYLNVSIYQSHKSITRFMALLESFYQKLVISAAFLSLEKQHDIN